MNQETKKIRVYNITFLQGPRSMEYICQELGVESLDDIDDNTLFEYLLQWHQDVLSHYDSHVYDADQINTEFLGYTVDDENTTWGYLLSRDNDLGYVGLSYFEPIEEGVLK